ncbi:MAG: hypothetical protein ACTSV3_02485 [Candidatus Thorarchaeota archaeon]|nr:MAG: hypothetical protein DRP09_12300 [Candidatus Thorarchaeota archaeon]RLI60185.1 MAG: hypothetical protein DRO87_00650 [Candidatus Thorarchaeota archaeon]
MSATIDRKEFDDLNFQIWRVKDDDSGRWRDEIYLTGDDDALRTLSDSLQSLLDVFQVYGKGTKRYRCNPPKDLNLENYGQEHGVQIQWLDMLVVRIGFDAMDDEPFILNDFVVELSVNPSTLKRFIDRTRAYLGSTDRYTHGTEAVCGLRFSPDWSGTE